MVTRKFLRNSELLDKFL